MAPKGEGELPATSSRAFYKLPTSASLFFRRRHPPTNILITISTQLTWTSQEGGALRQCFRIIPCFGWPIWPFDLPKWSYFKIFKSFSFFAFVETFFSAWLHAWMPPNYLTMISSNKSEHWRNYTAKGNALRIGIGIFTDARSLRLKLGNAKIE